MYGYKVADGYFDRFKNLSTSTNDILLIFHWIHFDRKLVL